ncbi:sulfurtransferase [Lederbergia citrea]|uniref:Sulfurtransferase n=1 Tax=Lederbergia citrea TaxID=2833581 RepID=A0A942Z252_9BACI|nr:sulfurtransferase [Lederbergia citrea]MBS4222148.1 sulfurtransferase [Lederbergia citrea]
MKYIKSSTWLVNELSNHRVRVVDCRFSLEDPSYGEKAYKENHIPGAVYFSLDKDLSGPVREHGGRHPLPSFEDFIIKLESAGIDHSMKVVAYDDGEGSFASRFWWMLKYFGHKEVYILDGGFKAWEASDYPLTNEIPMYKSANFVPAINEDMLATFEEVKARSQDGRAILIDSRAKVRYLGHIEPIDAKPGRIPRAINYEWTSGFENGKWKNKEAQKDRFSNLRSNDQIIVYCGSGVTATPNVLALMESGFEHVKLYAGSYSDWVSYPDNPVETGE